MPCTHPTRIPKIGLVAEFIQAPVKIRTMRVEEQSVCFCNDSNISFQSMYKRKQSSINECIEGFNPRMYYEIGPRKSTLFFHGQGFVTAGRCSDVSKAVPIPGRKISSTALHSACPFCVVHGLRNVMLHMCRTSHAV